MKQTGKGQMEASLRRLLDVEIMQEMLYFETVVWVETKSLQPKGFSWHFFAIHNSSKPSNRILPRSFMQAIFSYTRARRRPFYEQW
jgi:hypothetical protein